MGLSRQVAALAITCVFPILATLFVGARVLSRYLGQNHGWDDWLIYLSLLLLIGQAVTIYVYILLTHTGYYSSEIPPHTIEQQVKALKWSFAVQMFYHPLMGAIRASVIMFLFRVRDQRWHIRWALHVVFWINIGYLVSTTIVNIVQCDPIRYAYMRPQMDHKDASGNLIKGGTCINSLAFIMSSCGLSIFMDLIIMPIPTAMVWNLQMKRRTKLAVVAVMSMGWFATAASVSRLIIYHVRFAPYTDRTHNIGLVTSITEPSIGIIAACAPALRRLFTFFVPRYFSDEGSYDTHGYTQTNDATYGNTRPRPSHSFDAGKVVKIDMDVDGIPGRDEEDVYDMANLKGKVSREEMHMQRTHSVKTGVSESASHPCTRPTEPFGVLNQRQWSGPR